MKPSKTIIISGAYGFIGSFLTESLLSKGYRVIGIVKEEKDISGLLTDVDWCTIDNLENKANLGKVKSIIHLATSYGWQGDTSGTLNANLVLPVRLLQTALKNEIQIFISTDSFFSKHEGSYGHMPEYILSKRQFSDWMRILSEKSEKTSVLNLQLEHVYGERDRREKFFPQLVESLILNDPINLTLGKQKRDFIHVNDVVAAYEAILTSSELKVGFEKIEVGTGTSTSLKDFVTIAKKISGSNSELNFGNLEYRRNEIMYSCANTTKLSLHGWKKTIDLEEGLRSAIRATKLSIHAKKEENS